MDEYERRLNDLESKMKDMKTRKREYEFFPEYIDRLKIFVKNATTALDKIRVNKTWIAEEQFTGVRERITELSLWTENKTIERKQKPLTEEPILTDALVKAKISTIRALVKALNNIERPKPEKSDLNKTVTTYENKTMEDIIDLDMNETRSANNTENMNRDKNWTKWENTSKEGEKKIEDL